MWEQFEEQLVPLFEFLGIPMIILGPLITILFILFKYVVPKMLSKNTSVTGVLVANIVAQLFGEGDDVVKGVTELDLVKLIKSLPEEVQEFFRKTDEIVQEAFRKTDKVVQETFRKTDKKLNDVTELVALLSQAMMAERLLKPQSSRILQEIKSKADLMLAEANEDLMLAEANDSVDNVVEEDNKDFVDVVEEDNKEEIEKVEV